MFTYIGMFNNGILGIKLRVPVIYFEFLYIFYISFIDNVNSHILLLTIDSLSG